MSASTVTSSSPSAWSSTRFSHHWFEEETGKKQVKAEPHRGIQFSLVSWGIHVGVGVCRCATGMCSCMWRQDVNIECHSSGSIHLYFWDMAWGLLIRLGWLLSRSQGPSYLCLYSTEIASQAHVFLLLSTLFLARLSGQQVPEILLSLTPIRS